MTPVKVHKAPKLQRDGKPSLQPLKIYNSLTKRKESFTPLEPGIVRMYTCGLTVNNLMHIGHARCYIFWDVLERYLQNLGFIVKHVSNVTDISVDDRLLKRIKETGESFQQLVIRHTRDYFKDRHRLGIADPLTFSLATQHIHEMIELVQRLLDIGFAYQAQDGIYFRISEFPGYGRLAGIRKEKLQAGAGGRITQDEYDKEQMGDFALWKRANPGEPYWHSPWGLGRPGWHIECSAMAMKYLGETLDISGGGEDNIFPHHENTIAQSEAITGKVFVKYWIHVRHLLLNGEKMSKSTGNFLTARDAYSRWGAASVRLFILSTHYRKQMNFNKAALARIIRQLHQLQKIITFLQSIEKQGIPEQPSDPILSVELEKVEYKFKAALNDDFNTALAINHLFRYVNLLNRHLEPTPTISSFFATKVLKVLKELGTIIFGDLYQQEVASSIPDTVRKLVNLLLKERETLRLNKDYKRADDIRNALQQMGIEINDTSHGPIWWRKPNTHFTLTTDSREGH